MIFFKPVFIFYSGNQLNVLMKTSFLDYYKMVLEKVSFDPQLFNKEYQKAVQVLDHEEKQQFHQWMEDRGYSIPTGYEFHRWKPMVLENSYSGNYSMEEIH